MGLVLKHRVLRMKNFKKWLQRNIEVESNRTNFILIFIEFIESNQFRMNLPNFERIQLLKNLTPPYSWRRIESNEFGINFHRIFRIIFALWNQSNSKFSNRIERISIEFQFDANPKVSESSLDNILQPHF